MLDYWPSKTMRRLVWEPKEQPGTVERRSVVYRVKYTNCHKCYIGQTGRRASFGMYEHKLATWRHYALPFIATKESQEEHKFNLDAFGILDQAIMKDTSEVLETWYPPNHSVTRHIESNHVHSRMNRKSSNKPEIKPYGLTVINKNYETTSPDIHIIEMETAIHRWANQTAQSKRQYSGVQGQNSKGKLVKQISSREVKIVDETKFKADCTVIYRWQLNVPPNLWCLFFSLLIIRRYWQDPNQRTCRGTMTYAINDLFDLVVALFPLTREWPQNVPATVSKFYLHSINERPPSVLCSSLDCCDSVCSNRLIHVTPLTSAVPFPDSRYFVAILLLTWVHLEYDSDC